MRAGLGLRAPRRIAPTMHRRRLCEEVLAKRKGERTDSVNEDILLDRRMHEQRCLAADPHPEVIAEIERLQLGRRKGFADQDAARHRRYQVSRRLDREGTMLGKAAHGKSSHWCVLNHAGLPEVALLGHSNCGKSALLNALTGVAVRAGGLAEVSPRAGWTAELGFYRVQPFRVQVPVREDSSSGEERDEVEMESDESSAADDANATAAMTARVGGEEGGGVGDGSSMAETEAEVNAQEAAAAKAAEARTRAETKAKAQALAAETAAALTRPGGGMVLVDTPGYGFAVGDRQQLQQWRRLLQEYLSQARVTVV